MWGGKNEKDLCRGSGRVCTLGGLGRAADVNIGYQLVYGPCKGKA